mmetsp:Transcript_68071/g.192884  ORF Transcript_68071/g.192884 Transcript_68071/m.192884 type:complete len:227 (+) Transcript_68071:126-806(+)
MVLEGRAEPGHIVNHPFDLVLEHGHVKALGPSFEANAARDELVNVDLSVLIAVQEHQQCPHLIDVKLQRAHKGQHILILHLLLKFLQCQRPTAVGVKLLKDPLHVVDEFHLPFNLLLNAEFLVVLRHLDGSVHKDGSDHIEQRKDAERDEHQEYEPILRLKWLQCIPNLAPVHTTRHCHEERRSADGKCLKEPHQALGWFLFVKPALNVEDNGTIHKEDGKDQQHG